MRVRVRHLACDHHMWAHSPISLQRIIDDGYCLANVGLHALEQASLDFLGQEGVDLGLQLEADLAQGEGRGRGCGWRLFNPAIRSGRDAVGEMVVRHHNSYVCVRARVYIVL